MKKIYIGPYRDYGLVVLRYMNVWGTDKMRKMSMKLFNEAGFQLETETNLKIIDFLDVTLNLITSLYTPYKKPNNSFLGINISFDHPPQITKQLTNSIIKRLCENLANEQFFNTKKPEYENALHKGGYKSSL